LAFCLGAGLRLDLNFFIIRIDYGVPIYDPSTPPDNHWISSAWKKNEWWKWAQGLQFSIGYAF